MRVGCSALRMPEMRPVYCEWGVEIVTIFFGGPRTVSIKGLINSRGIEVHQADPGEAVEFSKLGQEGRQSRHILRIAALAGVPGD